MNLNSQTPARSIEDIFWKDQLNQEATNGLSIKSELRINSEALLYMMNLTLVINDKGV